MKFDINKIKLGSSKEPNLEKRLTDEYMGSLKTVGEGPQVNAELEGGEYLQLPTGEIKKSEGEKHEKGGIKMHIPDMTKILSNRLKLSAKDVKAIKEEFDIKLSTKTTYAKALERFDKKIGFQDALEDQEKHIKGLKKQIDDKNMDSGTKMLNHQHLSKKIYDSEKDKKELQSRRGLFFNFVFNLQEAGKSDSRKEMPKQGNFRYGGMKTPVMKFNVGGIKPVNTYENGGGDPPPNYTGTGVGNVWGSRWTTPEMQERYMESDYGGERPTGIVYYDPDANFALSYTSDNPNVGARFSSGQLVLMEKQQIDDSTKIVDKAGFNPDTTKISNSEKEIEDLKRSSKTIVPIKGLKKQWDAGNKGYHFQVAKARLDAGKLSDGGLHTYENGGLTGGQFKKLLNKFGISEDRGRQILQKFNQGGRFNELKNKSDLSYDDIRLAYENGDITLQEVSQLQATIGGGTPSGDIMFNPSFDITRTRFADLPAEKQRRGSTAYGSITKDNIEEVMLSLYRNFPDIVSSPKVFGVTYKDGKVDWDRSLDFSKVSSRVEQFQKLANKRMISSANTIVNNPNMFSESQIKSANDFLEKETFLDEAGKVRSYDSKLGQFTSGRFNIGMDLVNPEELETLQSNGIFTVKKLQEELEKNPELISDNSKARLEKLIEVMDEDSDYALTDYTIPVEEKQEEEEEKEGDEIIDNINVPQIRKNLGYLNIPDYAPLPPSGLMGTYMPTSRFTEIDPVRIGIEQQIQTTADAMRAMGDQIKDLPPQQRAIVLAQFQAERGNQLNKAAYDANVWNAQNLQNVEMYNAGQKDRMWEGDKADKLGTEMRTYTALGKQEEEWRNFYDDAIRRAMNREMIKSSLSILSSVYPDVSVSPNLDDIVYDPSELFAIQDSGNFGDLFGNPFV